MAIDFSRDRLEEVLDSYAAWWDGKLARPLYRLEAYGEYTGKNVLTQANCADLSISAEEHIDRFDKMLSAREWYHDGYPFINFDFFGPGITAAMCGARLDNSSGRVWFWPREYGDISEVHVRYDPENIWSKRIRELYRAGIARWGGSVVMGFPDLGGVLDVAASMCGTTELLMSMIDRPEEVDRLVAEAETAWREAYRDMEEALSPLGVYGNWSGLISRRRSYIIQCDACYMISNPMFRRFVLPTLARDCDEMEDVIYHLDGIGELTHLDDVLSIGKLKAVQWVQGDGKKSGEVWDGVYSRVTDAGKRLWPTGDFSACAETAKRYGGAVYLCGSFPKKDIGRYRDILKR